MQLRKAIMVYLWNRRCEYSQDHQRFPDLREPFCFLLNKHYLYWWIKLSYWPNARQSPLKSSKQHAASSCKPNQCCPFLHSLVPLIKLHILKGGYFLQNMFDNLAHSCRCRGEGLGEEVVTDRHNFTMESLQNKFRWLKVKFY